MPNALYEGGKTTLNLPYFDTHRLPLYARKLPLNFTILWMHCDGAECDEGSTE